MKMTWQVHLKRFNQILCSCKKFVTLRKDIRKVILEMAGRKERKRERGKERKREREKERKRGKGKQANKKGTYSH